MQPATSPISPGALRRLVAPADWSDFLDQVSMELANAPVLVDVSWHGLPPTQVARGVVQAFLYDSRADVIEIAIRIPTPGPFSVLRHLIDRPESVVADAAIGLLPSMVRIEDADGRVTRVRIPPSPAFLG